jgi:hypothetical protein
MGQAGNQGGVKMDDTRLEYSIGAEIYGIINRVDSRFNPTPEDYIRRFFKYLKNGIGDKYRESIKETGPYHANIEYKLDYAYNQLRLYVNGIMVNQILVRHVTLECVIAILIYMDVDSIEIHHGPFDGVEPWIDLWMHCEDCDILTYLLGSKFIDDPGKTCSDMIEHNVQLGRNEIVMELLRWKHDHLGHDSCKLRLD